MYFISAPLAGVTFSFVFVEPETKCAKLAF